MAGRRVLAVAAVVVVLVVAGARASTRLGDCTHNVHCDLHSCCRVGLMRYSIPTCSPRGDVGTSCSPAYTEPSSRTLQYPNGIQVVLEEAHLGLCPCRSGLVCTMGTCQVAGPDATTSFEYNSLNTEYD